MSGVSPYEHPPARICLAGRRRELEEVELEDLLSIVDEAEELARKGKEWGTARSLELYSPYCKSSRRISCWAR